MHDRDQTTVLVDTVTRLSPAATRSRTVGLVRGLDMRSRKRSAVLRRRLADRGVRVSELTTERSVRHRHRRDTVPDQHAPCLLVDTLGPGSLDAQRYAARLGIPLITTTQPAAGKNVTTVPVLGIHQRAVLVDVAVHMLSLKPPPADVDAQLAAIIDGRIIDVPARSTLPLSMDSRLSGHLSCTVGQPGGAITPDWRTYIGQELVVTPTWLIYRMFRDELPGGYIDEPVTIRPLQHALRLINATPATTQRAFEDWEPEP
jgi:hypothetical protein